MKLEIEQDQGVLIKSGFNWIGPEFVFQEERSTNRVDRTVELPGASGFRDNQITLPSWARQLEIASS